MLRNKQI